MECENYEDFLKTKRLEYKAFKNCYCPALKTHVIFNSQGFHHLLYDGFGKARTKAERIRRLLLISSVLKIIRNARQVFRHSLRGDKEYWLLKGLQGIKIVVVVLRRRGSGITHFYSLWDE